MEYYGTTLTLDEFKERVLSIRPQWSIMINCKPNYSLWKNNTFIITNHYARAFGRIIEDSPLQVEIKYSLPTHLKIFSGVFLTMLIVFMIIMILDQETTINGQPSALIQRILFGAGFIGFTLLIHWFNHWIFKSGLEHHLIGELKLQPILH